MVVVGVVVVVVAGVAVVVVAVAVVVVVTDGVVVDVVVGVVLDVVLPPAMPASSMSRGWVFFIKPWIGARSIFVFLDSGTPG